MKLFEGKSPTERNKIIVALVLGALSVLAIGNLIFQPFGGSKKTVTVNLSPTPTAAPNRTGDTVVTPLPKQSEINSIYTTIPVAMQYPPGGGDAGRNIFAFYEPPIPTPFSPTPYVEKKTPTPTPIILPTPNVILSFLNKQNVFEGEPGFRLMVGGDKFTPETYIFFNGSQLPTTFISPQQLSAEIPSNFIANAGQRTIEVKSADGQLFSNPIFFNVQEPPKPQFQYLGAVARKRGNNDTAYVQEQGKTTPSTFRLNDIIAGRFRLISIAPAKLLVQDINLTFLPPYSINLVQGSGQSLGGGTTPFNNRSNPNFPNPNFNDPSMVQTPQVQPNQQCPPGIPCDKIKPYVTPQPQKKEDVDDEDGDN